MSTTSFASLFRRQTDLTVATKHINQLTQQLSTLQPRSNSTTGADNSAPETHEEILEKRNDLSADIHAHIKQCDEDLDFLRQDVEDQEEMSANRQHGASARSATAALNTERAQELQRLSAGCVKLDEDLKLCRARFRKAQLQASANAERATQRERAAYLADLQAAAAATNTQKSTSATSDTDPPPAPKYTSLFTNRRGPKPRDASSASTQSDLLLTATTDVTTSLKRTHALLSSELSRSQFAQETLDASNAALAELNTRYSAFDDLLSKSGSLLRTLVSSTKSDSWYLTTAMWVLVGTIGWLLFRRLIYGPAWWFVWLPIKVALWTAWYAIAGVVGLVGKSTTSVRRPGMGVDSRGSLTHVLQSATAQASVKVSSSLDGAGSSAPDPYRSAQGSLSDAIGSEAEAPGSTTHVEATARTEKAGPSHDDLPRSGDGEPVQEGGEQRQPGNPKKRMWEEDVDRGEQAKDRSSEDKPEDDDRARKKDEL